MSNIVRNKAIHTAIARPGAGKTEALLRNLPAIQEAGKRVVLALPTLALIDHIEQRASSASISCRIVDHRNGDLVAPQLEAALREKQDSLIICTQEAVRRVEHSLLRGWMLVIDEVPKVVDYPDYPLNPIELNRVFEYTYEASGQLWIKDDLEQLVQDQVSTNRADSTGADCSTLGDPAAHIFRLLLCDVAVFIDKAQIDDRRHVRAVEEFLDWWKILSFADEVHVLAANIAGGEFEQFARIHGFTFTVSIFTPMAGQYTSPVHIKPIMPKGQIFSKAKMNSDLEGNKLYDVALDMILKETSSKPLLFANNWVRHTQKSRVHQAPMDSRGLNGYDTATEAILLFGGNPSPSDRKGLENLSEKYEVDIQEMLDAFVTTRLLEPSLQAVTRTAIRRSDNKNPIRLYVQDERVARYLVDTYMSDAVIDWSLSNKIPVKPDGRKKEHPLRPAVLDLLAKKVGVKEIARRTSVTPKTIRNWRDNPIAA
ncbi:DEAD/DEAH box helicase family protein [Pseudomonas sp. Pseusp16]|uniref:DEAD/DEAH box helicase family protein n=1 Tax=Pseudomonas sp. Pseusp16 TaxID=3243021 RepID=UPI0039B61A20